MANDYKVLYRKYRPTTFDEIVGQKYSIDMLKNAIINNKISHAYIFTGPRGTGKTSTAKIFAKTINCEQSKNGIPCGTCNSCKNINNNADIIEIDAASNNGVDEIRELINNVKIAPSFSKYKVYIIDEVHMLSQSAFNALLLTLEEPPSHIVFILATTNIESVPITILSRCQRYDFKKLSFEELTEHLKLVSKKEKIQISDDAIEEIAYLSEGGCRDALSILNQLSTSNSKIDLNVVLNNYGSVSLIQIKNIVQYYLNNDYNQLKNIFDNLERSAIDYKVFIKKLIDQLFNEAIKFKQNREDNWYSKIKETIFELNDLMNKININIDPFLLIFLVLVKYIDVDSIEMIEKENEKTESKRKEETILAENEKNIKIEENENYIQYLNELKKVRINNCFAKADKNLLKNFKNTWNDFNTNISSIDSLKPVIIDSQIVLASSEINIITNAQQSIVELFNNSLKNIEKKYKTITEKDIHFIALTTDEWEVSKKEYIEKLRQNYVYKIVDEPTYNTEETEDNIEEEQEISDEVLDIFDKDKVEIK